MMGSVTRGSPPASAGIGVLEQRQRQFLGQTAHLPQRLAAVEPERAEGIGCGELLQAGALQPAPPPQIAHVGEELPLPAGEVGHYSMTSTGDGQDRPPFGEGSGEQTNAG